jgi:hypothetical protein
MAIQINKPLAGGTGSITTGSKVGGSGSAAVSQATDIDALLAALVTAGIVSNWNKYSKADTPAMTGRHNYVITTPRKEAVDHVIDVLNLLDNTKVVGS